MANRFWVGGSGTWNSTAHWSTTSGGAGGSAVPLVSDDVIIDTNSGSPEIDLNNQAAVCKTLTVGDSAQTTPADVKTTFIKWTSSSTLVIAGNATFYGNVGFEFSDTTNQYFAFSASANFTSYTNSIYPYWNQGGSSKSINCLGSWLVLFKLKIFAGDTISVDVLSTGNVPIIWLGNVTITGSLSRFDFGLHRVIMSGAHYSPLFDSVFVGAAAPGFFISSTGVDALGNIGYLQIGSLVDQYGSNNFGYGQDNFTLQFANTLNHGFSMTNLFVENGTVSITGRNTITDDFGIGNNGRSVKVTFTDANKFANISDGKGEIVFPSATDQDVYGWSSDTTKGADTYVHSSTAGSPATLKVRGTYMLNHVRFKDITVSHFVLTTLDSYDISNSSATQGINGASSTVSRVGQVFNVPANAEIDSVVLWLSATSTPGSASLILDILAITGTPGSTAIPTGSALTTAATTFNANTLTTTPTAKRFSWLDGLLRPGINLAAGNYAIVFRKSGTGTPTSNVSYDGSSPTHSGNYASFTVGAGAYVADASRDVCFVVQGWVANTDPAFVVFGGTDEGDNSGMQFAAKMQKFYRYDVYNPVTTQNNNVIIGTIPSTEILSDFGYSNEINNVAGPLTIRRAVEPETVMYAGDEFVGYRNKVIVTCFSEFNPSGTKVYTGFISGWKPMLTGSDKYVDITVLSYASETAQFLVTDSPVRDVNISQSGTPLAFSSTRWAVSFKTGAAVTNLAALDLSAIGIPGSDNGYQVSVKIYKDNGSNTPDNTSILKELDFTVGGSDGIFTYLSNYVQISGGLTVSSAAKYWAVVDITGAASGDYIDTTQFLTTNSYADGNAAYWNGSAWVQSAAYGIVKFATYAASGDTTVSFDTQVYLALITIFENYQTQGGLCGGVGGGTLPSGDLDLPTADFKYTFQNTTIFDALNLLQGQAGSDWYWYDDVANADIKFMHKQDNTHQLQDLVYFQMERDVIDFNMEFTLEEVVNDLLLVGGDTGGGVNLFREYINYASVAQFGRRQQVMNDSNIVDTAVADAVGIAYIQAHGVNPTTRAPITISDAYFFETLHPGLLFGVYNMNLSNSFQISRIDFEPGQAIITAANVPTQVTNKVKDNTDQINQLNSVGNPTAPTVISV